MRNLCFVIIISNLCLNYGCTQKSQYADLEIPSHINWGIAAITDTVSLAVTYTNLAQKTVVIDYIDTPCACITAIPQHYYIKKGDSTVIEIKYKPREYGYIEYNLFIKFKNRKNHTHFVIKGKIKK